MEKAKQYYAPLDGIRALALVAVILFHSNVAWLQGGFLGVELFLVISGFIITTLLIREYKDTATIDIRAFYKRRLKRLLPANISMMMVILGVIIILYPEEIRKTFFDLFPGLTYTSNWFYIFSHRSYFEAMGRPHVFEHLWSLAVEFQFYIFWPWICGYLFRRKLRNAFLLIVIGAILSSAIMFFLHDVNEEVGRVYFGTDTRAAGFLIGASMAYIYPWITKNGFKSILLPNVVSLVSLGGIILSLILLHSENPMLYDGGFLGVAILSGIFIVVNLAYDHSWSAKLLSSKFMKFIGTRSYSLYLWHWPIFSLTQPYLDVWMDGWRLFALRMAITLLFSEMSYRLVEVPFKSGWIQKIKSSPRNVFPFKVLITTGMIIFIATLSFGVYARWGHAENEGYMGISQQQTDLFTMTRSEEGEDSYAPYNPYPYGNNAPYEDDLNNPYPYANNAPYEDDLNNPYPYGNIEPDEDKPNVQAKDSFWNRVAQQFKSAILMKDAFSVFKELTHDENVSARIDSSITSSIGLNPSLSDDRGSRFNELENVEENSTKLLDGSLDESLFIETPPSSNGTQNGQRMKAFIQPVTQEAMQVPNPQSSQENIKASNLQSSQQNIQVSNQQSMVAIASQGIEPMSTQNQAMQMNNSNRMTQENQEKEATIYTMPSQTEILNRYPMIMWEGRVFESERFMPATFQEDTFVALNDLARLMNFSVEANTGEGSLRVHKDGAVLIVNVARNTIIQPDGSVNETLGVTKIKEETIVPLEIFLNTFGYTASTVVQQDGYPVIFVKQPTEMNASATYDNVSEKKPLYQDKVRAYLTNALEGINFYISPQEITLKQWEPIGNRIKVKGDVHPSMPIQITWSLDIKAQHQWESVSYTFDSSAPHWYALDSGEQSISAKVENGFSQKILSKTIQVTAPRRIENYRELYRITQDKNTGYYSHIYPASVKKRPYLMIGDSVMLGAADQLYYEFGDELNLDAKVSRQFSEVKDLLVTFRNNGWLSDTVLIHLGTNGTLNKKDLIEILEFLKDRKKVVLMNFKVPRSWEAFNNALVAGMTTEYPNVQLIDWYQNSIKSKANFAKDGTHLTRDGVLLYTKLINDATGF